ncbi:MAG: hypothetical protein WC205_12235 [Opitutaceae bacterium]|jgi:hypothetical protein
MPKFSLIFLLGLAVLSQAKAAPVNDDISNATVLPSSRSVKLLKETIEGSVDGDVWYKWTAPTYGTVTMQFGGGFLTFPEAIDADTINAQHPTIVGASNLATYYVGGIFETTFTFPAVLGKTYYIHIDHSTNDPNFTGYNFGFILNEELGELPDNFDSAVSITTAELTAEGTNSAATSETNEPLHAHISNQKSVWFKWTAPQRSTVNIDTIGSSIDTVLAVYTGTNVSNLTEIAFNDDSSGGFNKVTQSAIKFTADAGTLYYFAIASKADQGGRLTFNFTSSPRKPDFTTEADTVYAKDGTSTSFHAIAKGTGTITYQWQRLSAGQTTWTDLVNDATFTGVTTTTLSVASVSFPMAGDQFRSVATDTVGTSYSRATKLVITEFAPLTTTVGGSDSLDLTNGLPPPSGTTYYVNKLPKGFVLDAVTGQITTSTTVTPKPGSYIVTYGTSTTGSNGKPVKSAANTVLIVVSALSADLSGGFEALLEEPSLSLPAGKVELLINSTTGAITGKLTSPSETKIYALKSKLALNSTYDLGSASIIISRGKNLAPYRLDIDINATSPGNPVLSASLKQLDSSNVVTATLSDTTSGVKLATYTTTSPTPWQGKYNLVLNDPSSAPVNLGMLTPPEGTGYGYATILAAKGLLTIKGKLGDGTSLTASLAPSADGSYRWYVKPYKTGGFFGGWIEFVPVSGITAPYKVSGTSDSELYWQKSTGTTKDKTYRAGFGPIGITATARLWTAPASGLNTALGLTNGALNSTFTSANLPGGDTALLPTALTLDNSNKIVVELPAANTDKFSAKVVTSTGAFTASLTLQDARKVTVEGVLLQQTGPLTTGTVIGEGFFTIPSLTKGNESVTGRIQFVAP